MLSAFRLAPRKGPRFAPLAACVAAAVFVSSATAQQTVPASQPLSGLSLELRRSAAQQAELETLLQAQQTPGNSEYRKWLTPEQFAQRFAPGTEIQQAASAWLQQQGFTVDAASRTGMRIAFSGTAAQLRQTFGTVLQWTPAASPSAANIVAASESVVPAGAGFVAAAVHGIGANLAVPDILTTLASAVEANGGSVVLLTGDSTGTDAAVERELLAEAAAEGITVLQTGSGPLFDTAATGVAILQTAGNQLTTSTDARPLWQTAPGLPDGSLRATPDASTANAATLAQQLESFAAQHGRVGALAPTLYRLRSGYGIFTHADASVPEGTWTAADGLGAIDTRALLKALAVGTTGVNVKLDASATTVTHGQALTLTYTVTGSGGTPSGTLTATLKGRSSSTAVTLGPTALNAGGIAAFTTNTIAGDIYDLSGTYSGDTTFAAGTSNTVTTTVAPEDVVLTAAAPTTKVGSTIPVTVTASSASGVGTPAGAVTVTAYGTGTSASTPPTYSATLASTAAGTASAIVSVPASAVGKYTFQANCTSDGSFACNQPKSFAVSVTQSAPTVTLAVTPEATVANSATQKYDLAVTVAAPAASTTTPTGTIAIQDNGVTLATVTLSGGAGTYVLSLSGTGHSLVAVYAGDTNYATASSAAVAVNGTAIGTATTLTASPTSVSYGSAVAYTVVVTPSSYASGSAATGIVTLRSSLQGAFATGTLSAGTVTISSVALQAGTHTITAVYPGDTNYAASTSSAVTVTVKPGKVASTTALTVLPLQPLAGQNTTLTATVAPTVSDNSGTGLQLICTGQVTFFSNNVYLGAGSLAAGVVSVTAQLKSGSNSLTAVYNGDTACYGSTSTALVVSPLRVASAVTLQPGVTTINAGRTIQLTAAVSAASASTLGTPAGTVTFYDVRSGVQTPVGSGTLTTSATGRAVTTVNVDGSVAGEHSFLAVYGGDGTFLTATSDPATVTFGDFGLTLTPQSITVARGGVASTVATLTMSSGYAAPVVLTCATPASSLMACAFQPSTLTGAGSTTLTVTTTGSTIKTMLRPGPGRASPATVLAAGLPFFAAACLLHRRRRIGGFLLLLACAMLAGGGCGLGIVGATNNQDGGTGTTGGTTASGTPLGTQLLTITASSSDGTLRHSYTYPVIVQ